MRNDNNLKGLNKVLFDSLRHIQGLNTNSKEFDNEMKKVKAIKELGTTIVNSAKVELEARKTASVHLPLNPLNLNRRLPEVFTDFPKDN